MDVSDSDHKPVYARLSVQLPWYEQQALRRASLQYLWQAAAAASGAAAGSASGRGAVTLAADQGTLVLQGSYLPASLRLRHPAVAGPACRFAVEGAGGSLPAWLEVAPAVGLLPPGGSMALRLQGTKAQWGASGSSAELRLLAVLEGSVDAAAWPAAAAPYAVAVEVVLP